MFVVGLHVGPLPFDLCRCGDRGMHVLLPVEQPDRKQRVRRRFSLPFFQLMSYVIGSLDQIIDSVILYTVENGILTRSVVTLRSIGCSLIMLL